MRENYENSIKIQLDNCKNIDANKKIDIFAKFVNVLNEFFTIIPKSDITSASLSKDENDINIEITINVKINKNFNTFCVDLYFDVVGNDDSCMLNLCENGIWIWFYDATIENSLIELKQYIQE